MTIKRAEASATATTLTISLSQAEMSSDQQEVVGQLSSQLKLDGFRVGHTPPAVARQHLEPQAVSKAFLERIVARISEQVLNDQPLPPVLQPEITVTKFVPFSQLELTISYQHTSKIELADYLNLPVKLEPATAIEASELKAVIDRLRTDLAEAKPVKRAAKKGDRVRLDFSATTTSGQALAPLTAKDHSLVLGSQSMPPGFEQKLVGATISKPVDFKLKLPNLPSMPDLSQLMVKFSCRLKQIEELKLPAVDDKLASQLGEYQQLKQLKQAIKQQLEQNQRRQADLNLDNQIIDLLRRGSQLSLPKELLKQQLEQNLASQEQSLKQAGLTYQQWLKAKGLSQADHAKQLKRSLKRNLKVSSILSEIAKTEQIKLSDDDFNNALKTMVQAPQKATPAVKSRLRGRMLAEATILFLRQKLQAKT